MTIWPALLLATLLLPVAGALTVSLLGQVGANRRTAWCRATALAAAALSFLASAVLFAVSPTGSGDFVSFDAGSLLHIEGGSIDVRFSLGLDGLGLPFVGATTLLTLAALLADPGTTGRRGAGYYSLVLLLEAGLLGTFLARDVVLFHLFAESATIWLFLLIGIWGNRQRRTSALKLLIFGSCGGLLVLAGMLAMALWNYPVTGRMTTSLGELTAILAESPIPPGSRTVILLLLLAGLAAKAATFPLHGWLPAALAEAPAATGMILTGAALGVGGYGLLRFGRVLLPDAVVACSIWLSWLFVAGIIFAGVMAMLQSDLRRLLGYACASQMGLCMLGLFSANDSAVCGGVLKLIAGGLAVGGLLLLLEVVHHRADSARIESRDTGRWRRPILVTFVLLLAAANAGMPGTAGFNAMRSILSSLPGQSRALFGLTVLGIALGVCYTIKLTWRMLAWRDGSGLSDRPNERILGCGPANCQILAAGLLSVFILWIGLAPGFLADRLLPTDVNPRPIDPQSQTTNN
jgi:NADH-quinone oxidoreductase subunit M